MAGTPNPLLDLATSLVQKALAGLGTVLMTQGVIDQQLDTTLIGCAPLVVGIGWGLISRWRSSKVAIAAHAAGVDLAAVKAAPMPPKP